MKASTVPRTGTVGVETPLSTSLLAGVERDETVMGARSWAAIHVHDGKIVAKVWGFIFGDITLAPTFSLNLKNVSVGFQASK